MSDIVTLVTLRIDAYNDRVMVATGLLNSGYKVSVREEPCPDFTLTRKAYYLDVENRSEVCHGS